MQGANTFRGSFKKVLFIGVVVSLLGALVIYYLEKKRHDLAFAAQSNELITSIGHQVERYLGELSLLAAFVDAKGGVDPEEFEVFAEAMQKSLHDEELIGVTYANYVRDEELESFVDDIRSQYGVEQYRVIPEGRREHYMLLRFSNLAQDGVLTDYGFDLFAPDLPYYEDAQRAIDSGELIITPRLTLLYSRMQGQTERDALVIRKAVYRNGEHPETVMERREQLLGLVVIAFKIHQFFELILKNNYDEGLHFRVVDCGPTADLQVDCETLFDNEDEEAVWSEGPSQVNHSFEVGGRQWELLIAPSLNLFERVNWLLIVMPSLLLMLLSGVLALFVVKLSKEHSMALEFAFDRADHDELTKLSSRNRIQQDLRNAVIEAEQEGRCLAVLFIDLDHFKKINDTLGHSVGDDLLKLVAERLQNYFGIHTKLGRLGGDEFLVFMEFDSIFEQDRIVAICEGLLKVVRQPYRMEPRNFTIGCSIGIAVYPEAGEDAGSLVKAADMAMYEAKNEGRSTYRFFNESMSDKLKKHVHLESLLRGATERGELSVQYQPKVDLLNNSVVGCEALLRWHNSELGAVSPVDFIPVAEDSGQIHEIGEWVLAAVCEQIMEWRLQGLDVPRVAINISAVQVQRSNFLSNVKSILDQFNLPANSLEFELTENILVENSQSCKSLLDEIKSLGIYLALDDFGTGFSSLSYLKMFPFDSVKIDRSFVRDLVIDPNDAALTQAIISMGHSLGMEVVAEGVEDEAQLEFLLLQRCDFAQGYFFSKPISAEDMSGLLKANVKSELPFQQLA